MSRTSRIPYHQNVYDLFQVVALTPIPDTEQQIVEWEQRNARIFPAAMKEFYSTSATLRLGGDSPQTWTLTLPELWSEFSNDDHASSVAEVLLSFVVMRENQGCWDMRVREDGTTDPIVDVSRGYFFGPPDWAREKEEWNALGPFTNVVFSRFAEYYANHSTPTTFKSDRGYFELGNDPDQAPPKPYHNGLWLRSPAEPFEPAVIDFLIDQFGEPERTPRPGNVTTYTFRPDGGIIRITADEPSLGGGLSAWWVHADTSERLTELARLIVPFGTLRETLRADTEAAREVLTLLQN